MTAKQLSVFIENRQGRLGEVLAVLKKNDVNILSLSLADTTEYGLLRILVNKPEKGKEMMLKEMELYPESAKFIGPLIERLCK